MILAHAVPPFTARGLSGNTDEETDWRRRWERLKHEGSTIRLQAEVHLGHMSWAPTKRRRRRTPSEPIPFKDHTIFVFRALSSIRSTCRYYVWQVMDVRCLSILFWGMTLYQWIIISRRFEATHLQGSIWLLPVDPWRWGLPTDAASHPRRTEFRLHRWKIYTTMRILFFRFGSTLAACWTRGVRTWRIMAADTSGLL
jgi:hypothetical protein